jgi:hypothetical protein
MGERPIFHIRVKKAKNVNRRGAMMNSYWSNVSRRDCGFCADPMSDPSS